MDIYHLLRKESCLAFEELFNQKIDEKQLQIEATSTDHTGDLTLVVFPLLRYSRKSPVETASLLGESLKTRLACVEDFEVIKGFLNLLIAQDYWLDFMNNCVKQGELQLEIHENPQSYLIEYSSPNTNKPLHLGHIRNNLIGHAVAEILKIRGHQVVKANLINDRGIHICKSMVAWLNEKQSKTPENTSKKGDHFVGDYYVLFDREYKKQVQELQEQGWSREKAEKEAPLMKQAQEMLISWEKKDPETRKIWSEMNAWVYKGFDVTYDRMGISFDKVYHESETYLLGKKLVEEGLKKGVFFRKEDDSVWVDLTAEGLDENYC
jgi:arginyl-tRNA synthetase